ncbi:MAG: hypothetical protein H7175_14525, partial [Burkholderiales bacterium]|nr:hypothetical protein [Anaerolineae bacterium]
MDQQTNDSGLLKRIEQRKLQLGQALVEYALILALVAVALGVAIAATGPAIGNVFSNTVYNLLGQTLTPVDLVARGGPTAFWLTVTWVASQTPVENIGVGSNPAQETQVPPATSIGGNLSGASQTPTLTPSDTPAPSDTPIPSDTPVDFTHTAPFYDPVENAAWWRINTDVMVDGMLWEGTFYPNTDLTEPANQALKRRVVTDDINYNWGSGAPISGWGYTDFSVRWVRGIYLPADTQIRFKAQADDGARLFIDGVAVAGIDDWAAGLT